MTYQKLTSDELKKIKRIEQITNIDYELFGDFILIESFMGIVEDLLYEFDRLKEINDDIAEELKELRKEKNENFEKNPYISLGISESDFH